MGPDVVGRTLSHVHAGGHVPLLQIAPMMEVTYRDFRYFMRLLTRRAQLWTEMVVDDTLLHNLEPEKCDRFLAFHKDEHPIVCQLGGSDPEKLARAAEVVERYGYDEVNLNVGCPSSRVASKGEFGCSLMTKPTVVRDIINKMRRTVQIPVTVKCRLGVDDTDSQEFTREFVRTVAQGGCKHFIIHSRKAWLQGLSPAQNRSIPPLQYPRVLDLCREFPDLAFSLNGGVNDLGRTRALLGFPGDRLDGECDDLVSAAWGWSEAEHGSWQGIPSNFHGVMIGRGAMNNPVMLWDADRAIYGDPGPAKPATRRGILDAYCRYLEEVHPPGDPDRSVGVVHMAVKPTLGLFAGLKGTKAFRAALDSIVRQKPNRDSGPAFCLEEAVKTVETANPGLLDEPLLPCEAYRPSAEPTTGAADGGRDAIGGAGEGRPGAKKRKRDAAIEAIEAAQQTPPQPTPQLEVSTVSAPLKISGTSDTAVDGGGGDAKEKPVAVPVPVV